jgi:hypothetical protein
MLEVEVEIEVGLRWSVVRVKGCRPEGVYMPPRGADRLGTLGAHVLFRWGIRSESGELREVLARAEGHGEGGLRAECMRNWAGKDRCVLFEAGEKPEVSLGVRGAP